MKKHIDALIVVEGKMDIAFLSSFLDADFYSVNGSAITKKDLDYIKKASEVKTVIVLTDPDFPGKKIRTIISDNVPNISHAYVRKEVSIKNHKVGVAESTKEEVIKALENIVCYSNSISGSLTSSDLYDLELLGQSDSRLLRKKVCEELHLGHANGKDLLKRLNMLNISKEEIKRIIKNVNN